MPETTGTRTQYYTAATLDGFIADRNHSLEWLLQFGVQAAVTTSSAPLARGHDQGSTDR